MKNSKIKNFKNLTIYSLLLFCFMIFNINISSAAFVQKSTTQNSAVLGTDDILKYTDHNNVVLDISNLIIDIGGLKNYVATGLVSVWSEETESIVYSAKNVFLSKNLQVVGETKTNKLNVAETMIPANVITGFDLKDQTIKGEDLNIDVFSSIKETFKLNGLNAYYNSGNVGIGNNAGSDTLTVSGNIAIYSPGNGFIFPDGTKQTSATVDDTYNVKLTGDQNISGDKTFNNGIQLATGPVFDTISNDSKMGGYKDTTVVTEKALKEYVGTFSGKTDGKCGYDNGYVGDLQTKNLCATGTESVATTTDLTNINNIRYIRDWATGNSVNKNVQWVEIKALQKTTGTNIALAKAVTTNGVLEDGTLKPLTKITDNDVVSDNYSGIVGDGYTPKYVQIDLGAPYDIEKIQIYRVFSDSRIYYNINTEVSLDGTNWIPLYSSQRSGTYKEVAAGKTLINFKGSAKLYNWTCTGTGGGMIDNCKSLTKTADPTKTIVTVSGNKQWSDGTYAKSCFEYKNPVNTALYSYTGDTGSGTYNIQPTTVVIPVYCDMVTNDGGWTLVYKSGGQNSMKTTASQNLTAIKDTSIVGTPVGKMDDADIRAIYKAQFKVSYSGYTADWFCKFTNGIATYGDNVVTPKLCSLTYDTTTNNYTTVSASAARNRGFSTRDVIGARILQLNYYDARLGSHIINGVGTTFTNANTCDMKQSGLDRYGCYGTVWVR